MASGEFSWKLEEVLLNFLLAFVLEKSKYFYLYL
jgi:hypothetical protein